MVRNNAKKPTGQNYFDGSNKYTNGSHWYRSAFFVTHLKNLLEKLQSMLTTTKCANCQNGTQSSKQHLMDLISMHGVGQAAREDHLEQNRDQKEYRGRASPVQEHYGCEIARTRYPDLSNWNAFFLSDFLSQ